MTKDMKSLHGKLGKVMGKLGKLGNQFNKFDADIDLLAEDVDQLMFEIEERGNDQPLNQPSVKWPIPLKKDKKKK